MSDTEPPTTTDPIAALRALETHLSEREGHGVERVYLSPGALADLNALPAAVAARTSSSPPVEAGPTAEPEPEPDPARDPQPALPRPAETTVVAEEEPQPNAAVPTASGSDEKRLQLRELAIRAKHCEATRGLGSLRDKFVFATGNPDAELMLVGEAPGAEEEKVNRPFVGPAGKLLDKIIGAMGLDREQVYISNIVKFRPSTGDPSQGSRNRKPTAEEMATSVKYVIEEIGIVQPKAIVALGGTAMEGLLGLEGSVSSQRSKFHRLRDVPVMVTYHPSYLLRSGQNQEKRKVWEDMMLVMEQLGMPVSAKQRSYFL